MLTDSLSELSAPLIIYSTPRDVKMYSLICHGLKLPVARPGLRGLPRERVKSQLQCLSRGTFSTAPSHARDGLVATPRLPRQVPRG